MHVRVGPGNPDSSNLGELAQAARRRVAVHAGTAAVEQDRPADAGADGLVYGPSDRWRQRDQDNLGAFAAYAQHPVAVLVPQVSNVRASGLEDAQAEQPEHLATSAKSQG